MIITGIATEPLYCRNDFMPASGTVKLSASGLAEPARAILGISLELDFRA
jgi:hypothetical protein